MREQAELQQHWTHKGRVVLKFRGVEDIAQAEALIGCEVQVPRSERAQLEPGSHYIADLVGCTLFNAAEKVGQVAEVQFGAGEAPLLVVRADKRELVVPFAEEFLRRVDLRARCIEMALPEGMLQLDAPLSEEEKRAQHAGGSSKPQRRQGRRRDARRRRQRT